MPKYSPVYTKTWNDREFEKLCPQGKLLFLYLITNPQINNSGIYEITIKAIGSNTGIKTSTVAQLLSNGSIKNILYDMENEIVFVINRKKYSPGGNPAQVEKGIISEFKQTSKSYLWSKFVELNPQFKEIFSTVDQPLVNGSIPLPLPLPLPLECSKDLNNNKPSFDFDYVWSLYPNRVGKKMSLLHFNASVKTDQDFADIQVALAKYKASVAHRRKHGHPDLQWQNGSTFFYNWRDWVDYEIPPTTETDTEQEIAEHEDFLKRYNAAGSGDDRR